jgi:hypothetical protein
MSMRMQRLVIVAAVMVFAPLAAVAGMDHAAHGGKVAHEQVIDGVKVTFSITNIADEMRAKGLALPMGMQATHHLAAAFMDVAGKQALRNGLVAIRVQGPGQTGEPKELAAMDGHFGIDLDLSRPGSYGIMCRFVLDDGKKRQTMFQYDVKK